MTDGLPPEADSFALPGAPCEGEALRALTLGHMAGLALAVAREGVANPASPLRKPALATLSAAGAPAVRTVFLRGFDAAARRLAFFTDIRSPKAAELARDSRASMLFYDPACDIQVRFGGHVEIRGGDAAAWESAAPSSRRAYLVVAPPGSVSDRPTSGLPADVEGVIPPLERMEEGRGNFALAEFIFGEADVLVLSRTGHRRARICWQADAVRQEWLVP